MPFKGFIGRRTRARPSNIKPGQSFIVRANICCSSPALSACAGAVAMLMLLPGAPASAQQKAEVTLSRQPGIFYMPSHIMEKNKLIEKHAASLGVPGVTTKWINLSGGGAQTDALLAGGVDILNTGTGNLLLQIGRAHV